MRALTEMGAKIWIAVQIKAETDRALLVDAGMQNDSWLPKSQILDYSDDYQIGDNIEIEIAEWLAMEKDLI